MARTDATSVKAIMESTALSDGAIDSIISVANNMVTELLDGQGLSTATLKNIESYLTAHLIAIGPERQAMEEYIDKARVKYQGEFGKFLQMTTYGQMVLTLDTTGKFANQGKRRVKAKAIGQVKDYTVTQRGYQGD